MICSDRHWKSLRAPSVPREAGWGLTTRTAALSRMRKSRWGFYGVLGERAPCRPLDCRATDPGNPGDSSEAALYAPGFACDRFLRTDL